MIKPRSFAKFASPAIVAVLEISIALTGPRFALAQFDTAQFDFEKPPIDYHAAESHDPVAELWRAIQAGKVEIEYDPDMGWLRSLLEHLQISQQSQLLVFSKTSQQVHRISPDSPRALYFNDNVYIGVVQGGHIEIGATDPQKGAVFYTVRQSQEQPLRIIPDRGQCLTCHATHRTQEVPGYLVRSVFADFNGRPRTGTRTYVTDHRSDFEKRYGGWYVTGRHAAMRHMGNAIARNRSDPELLDRDEGANRTSLDGLVDTSPYLTNTSDIVALMILEHQSQMHNLIARANYEARTAEYRDENSQPESNNGPKPASESSERRLAEATENLVRYMLFADETELAGPIEGNNKYAKWFQSPKRTEAEVDSKGRSLRQFDLQTRMFKYPCSYLIYSAAFDGLPQSIKSRLKFRLSEILKSTESVQGYEHLSQQDRKDIREILQETKPGFVQ